MKIFRYLLLISLVLPITVLSYDMYRLFYPKTKNKLTPHHPTRGTIAEVNLVLSQLRFDKTQEVCTVDVLLAARSTADIKSIYFSYYSDPNTKERDWLLFSRSGENFFKEWEETPAPNASPVSVVWVKTNLEIKARTIRQEVMFPFDAYNFSLNLSGCINDEGNACLSGKNVYYKTVVFSSAGDSEFTIDSKPMADGTIQVSLKRKLFVRVAIVYFLFVATVYSVFLCVYGDAKDVMAKSIGIFAGLFGLRALVVPKTITILPTLFEYLLLAILILFFCIITYKLGKTKPPTERIT